MVLSDGIFGFVLGSCTLAFVLPLFVGCFSVGSENFNYGFEIVSKWTHGYSRLIGIILIIFGVFMFYSI